MTSKKGDPKLKTPQKHHFKSGTLVEVRPNGEGFLGSWYTGKVIGRTSEKYFVEYQKLFEDDKGAKNRQEIIDWEQVRPIAPREKIRKFRIGENVDAFYRDGWWVGSIANECGNGKFNVFLRGTEGEVEFGEDDLRLHREWMDGEWNPPLEGAIEEKKRKFEDKEEEANDSVRVHNKARVNAEPIETVAGEFSKGMLVEVSSDEEGFEGAWFAATIVESLGKNRYLIEYEALRTEDDTGFLREEFAAEYIRPSPPETIMIDRFKLLDEVDALYNDGWWVGVISKVLSDDKYIVYFRESQEELMFRHDDLRLHQDWIAQEWRTPSLALTR